MNPENPLNIGDCVYVQTPHGVVKFSIIEIKPVWAYSNKLMVYDAYLISCDSPSLGERIDNMEKNKS